MDGYKEFIKYFISICISFVFDVFFLFFLTEYMFLNYLFSASISTSIGFSINYYLNVKWVFNYRYYKERPAREYSYMILISLFVSIINIILVWFFTEFLLFFYMNSKFAASFLTFFIKFMLKKFFLFSI